MDAFHVMGSDLALSPAGDLLTASGATATQQRVLRRLLSGPGQYIWHVKYGAGLPGMVGQVANAARIRAIILRQMRMEKGVGATPAPTVDVSVQPGGTVTAHVRYADQLGTPQQFVVTP